MHMPLPLSVLQQCGGLHCAAIPADHWQLRGVMCVGVSAYNIAAFAIYKTLDY